MKKSVKSSIGIGILVLGILTLGVDRMFISADTGTGYFQSTTVVTVVALVLLLIGAIWLFRTVFE